MTTKQEILSWPLEEVEFPVNYSFYGDKAPESRVEKLLLPPPLEWLGIMKGTHYDNLTNAIENASGFSRQVLIDLYRNVALGNFTAIRSPDMPKNTRLSREQSEAWARRMYPEQGTLPWFVYNLSKKTTLCGLLIYNLLRHKDQSDPAYRMVGAVLRTYREMEACPKKKDQSEYLIEFKTRRFP